MHLFARGMLHKQRASAPLVVPVRIDVNRAPMPELMTLPGIGPGRAEAIILHRVRHGPFTSPEDLLAVEGIGPGTLAGMSPHVVFSRPQNRRRP